MMHLLKNGEPVFHAHNCPVDRAGKRMTPKELHDFAVDVLMSEYAETNVKLIKYDKKESGQADFCFVAADQKAVNVLVVYDDEIKDDYSHIDTSWMVNEYYRTGALPRITIASAWCDSGRGTNGKPAICGANFCFKYHSISLLPNQANEPLEKMLTPIELAAKYAETWRELDASFVAPYLDKDFHYGSDWAFDELPCRAEYLDYFRSKLSAIRRKGSRVDVSIGRNRQTGEVAVLLKQNGNSTALVLRTSQGRIMEAHMKEYDARFVEINPADELYQGHGDHIGGIMPAETFVKNKLPVILKDSKVWIRTKTSVTMEDMYDEPTDVLSMRYGTGDMSMLALVAYNPNSNSNHFMSVYPLLKGNTLQVNIDKVTEWDNQAEATVYGSIGEFKLAFFATDYYANKGVYQAGNIVDIDLAALGLNVKEGQRGFSFKGQQAIDWLAKMGKEPDLDEQGNVLPVQFNLCDLVAYLNLDSKCPDEAEFQSPASDVTETKLLGVEFLKTDITICRRTLENGNKLVVNVPLYFKKQFFPQMQKGDPISGWLWLIGNITDTQEPETNACGSLSKMCADFVAFMRKTDFKQFDNLTHVVNQLPLLKIKDGYEFDAFQIGDSYGAVFHGYCCKVASNDRYYPTTETGHVPYDDSKYILDCISRDEAADVPPALDYFDVPFTEEGIMQAWLLDNIHEFMPRFWHACYGMKTFIFDEQVVYQLCTDYKAIDMEVKKRIMALDAKSLLPSVEISGNTAIVNYAYWSSWRGLVAASVEAVADKGKIHFRDPNTKVLVEYRCGIVF